MVRRELVDLQGICPSLRYSGGSSNPHYDVAIYDIQRLTGEPHSERLSDVMRS
jgi:hypothetical protein